MMELLLIALGPFVAASFYYLFIVFGDSLVDFVEDMLFDR